MGNIKAYTDKNKLSKKAQKELNNKQRGDWNGIKPYTRVQKDKTKFTRHPKHKGKGNDDFEH